MSSVNFIVHSVANTIADVENAAHELHVTHIEVGVIHSYCVFIVQSSASVAVVKYEYAR